MQKLFKITCCFKFCNKFESPYLKFQADKHGQADEAETEDADGKADQPAEHSPLPGWVEKLLTACHWTATLNSLIYMLKKESKITVQFRG